MHLDSEQKKRVFALDLHQVAIMFLFGLGIFVVVNISAISLHFTEGTILSKSDVQASISEQLSSWFSSPIFSKITLVAFWVIIGLIAYMVLFWLYSVFTEAQNEIVVEKDYVNKQTKKDQKKWPMKELVLLIGLLALAILTLTVLFPLWNTWFVGFIFDIPSNIGLAIIELIGSMAGMFVTIYLFKIVISTMLVLE